MQIALLKCLARAKQAEALAPRNTLLLIDEPELYLHPHAVENTRDSLRRLSAHGYQTVFTTHSAHMITRQDAANTVLVRRNAEAGTYARPRLIDAVTRSINGANHQSEVLFDLSVAAKILFSDRVVLVEGKTEGAILPDLFEAASGTSLGSQRMGLVKLHGSENIPKSVEILNSMGISTKVICDLDFYFKIATKNGLSDDNHIASSIDIFQRLKDEGKILLDENGFPKKGNNKSASDAFELFATDPEAIPIIEQAHLKLRKSGIWLWRRGSIESHLGLSGKNTATWSEFVSRITDQAFFEGMPDSAGIRELASWLQADG